MAADAWRPTRGGGRRLLALDFEVGERCYGREPVHDLTAESIYERRWASTLLDRIFTRLSAEFDHAGSGRNLLPRRST